MKYPVFGQDRDRWMFMISSESELGSLEAIDIEGKEYTGWNVAGIPVEFFLDKGNIKIKPLSEVPQIEEAKKAILNYAAIAKPKVPFNYYGPEDDMVGLFKAVEQHIKSGSLKEKIKRFIKKYLKEWKRGEKGSK